MWRELAVYLGAFLSFSRHAPLKRRNVDQPPTDWIEMPLSVHAGSNQEGCNHHYLRPPSPLLPMLLQMNTALLDEIFRTAA